MYARIFLDHIEGSVLTLFPCRQQCIAATGSAASSEPCGVRRVLPLDGSRRHDWIFRNLWNDVDVFNVFHMFFFGGEGMYIYIYMYISDICVSFLLTYELWTMKVYEGFSSGDINPGLPRTWRQKREVQPGITGPGHEATTRDSRHGMV
jgi:hypothetical protein